MTSTRVARVAVDVVEGRACLTELSASTYLRPRVLDVDGPRARVAIVGSYAMLLADDDLRIDIRVGRRAQLELVEPSGIVAYDARGGSARWHADVAVAAGGLFVWDGAPFVVAEGADVQRSTSIRLEYGAAILVREFLVLGRTGETLGGALRACMDVTYDGGPLLVEQLDLTSPGHWKAPGVIGESRVHAMVSLLGTKPERFTRGQTELAGPGALARALAAHAHLADAALADTWREWYATILERSAGQGGRRSVQRG